MENMHTDVRVEKVKNTKHGNTSLALVQTTELSGYKSTKLGMKRQVTQKFQ